MSKEEISKKVSEESALKQTGELADSDLENVAGGLGDLVINTGDVNISGTVNLNVTPEIGDAAGTLVDAASTLTGSGDAAKAVDTAVGGAASVVSDITSGFKKPW